MNNTDKLSRTYDMDKIDDLLCELDNTKIRINALMDFNLKLKRINNEQINKGLFSNEFERLSPIIELLNNESFESLDHAINILENDMEQAEVKKPAFKAKVTKVAENK
ncbi:hypothetical protein [Companilactobacillus pabuli]|jgi:hypothetical protein|uniref:Uncharacterized protein n=1 Tax=Companilactobacillus pabuli TaxID=2714036 RepID=A0A7L7KV93_9LACO|nr:hypothetical protein [Companilactobacillus pabuli]AKP04197.1 hypothetical protein ABB45_11555 [Companilactobacillus farciminis]AKS52503.1 hypothetical protein ABB44_11575 [Companilactobacillus farciminis]MDG5113523.1 hypothetical protein [Companilactobacillus pabuli]QMT83743.1 hypothetical protein G6534_03525 [Companilactobacillus pabuli]GAQ01745.1 hypothetical protein NBRC111452_1560 [Companilactobacillus farciminis]